jgi:hypothetical protein
MSLPKEWTTVTPFSRILALILFILLPLLTFVVGMKVGIMYEAQLAKAVQSITQFK